MVNLNFFVMSSETEIIYTYFTIQGSFYAIFLYSLILSNFAYYKFYVLLILKKRKMKWWYNI